MKRIGIRELHLKTCKWVRNAPIGERVVVTDRGHSVTSLPPVRPSDLSTPFRKRRTLPEFDAAPTVSGDSSAYVSEDGDRG